MSFDTTGLLEPQKSHAEFLADALKNHGISADFSGTGTGKTFVGASIMRELKRKFVIICPRLNIPKWKAVLSQFGLSAELIINYEKLARGNIKNVYRYKTKGQKNIPYFLRGEFRIPKDWVVLLDESHRTKGIESLQAGLLYALKSQGYSVHCMSATQAMTPLDMRAFGFATNLHKGMHLIGGRGQNNGMNLFKQFCESAGAEYKGHWGAMFYDDKNPESKAKLQAIRDNLFNVQKIASRMNRADFGNIFPKNQIEATAYDMGENGKKIGYVYTDMAAEIARLEDRCKDYALHVLAIITKARRMAELLKVPSLCEMTEDLYDEGKSILIFVNYADSIEALVSRLSKKFGADMIAQIHGGVSIRQRFDDIAAFQADRKRITVANLAAGGECIDLHDITGVYPRASLINPSFRAIAVLQSIGRHDRAYAKSDCLTNLVLADGTIETNVAHNFNGKKGHLDILNDGDLVPNGPAFKFVSGMNI